MRPAPQGRRGQGSPAAPLLPLLALLLCAGPPRASAQGWPPTPIPFMSPEAMRNGQFSRAFQRTPAVGRFAHVAAATGDATPGLPPGFASNTLVVAGGVGADQLPATALASCFMGADSVSVDLCLPASASGFDALQMPLSNTAYDVVSDDWAARATSGYILAYGGPDWTGATSTPWVAKMPFSTMQWSWLQL
jgi:hypothetical protein